MSLKDYVDRHSVGIIVGITAVMALIVVPGVTWEYFTVPASGTWNPTGQIRYVKQQKQQLKEEQKQLIEEQKMYESMYGQLLVLADSDNNGVLTLAEQADAWKRMGLLQETIVESGVIARRTFPFQPPKLEDLERAIESYQR